MISAVNGINYYNPHQVGPRSSQAPYGNTNPPCPQPYNPPRNLQPNPYPNVTRPPQIQSGHPVGNYPPPQRPMSPPPGRFF